MEFLALIAVAFLAMVGWSHLSGSMRRKRLPPGPYPLPIVGNIFQMGGISHLSLARLSKKYGPVMSIRLGSLLNVVVSSPEMAKEVLTRQGFTGRCIGQAARVLDHDKMSVGLIPLETDKWKEMRKISKEQMFAHHSLEKGQNLRHKKLQQLLDYVQGCCDGGRAVDIRATTFTTMLNVMSATMFSTDIAEFDSSETREFKEIMEGNINVFGRPNFADYFPIFERFDPQKVRGDAEVYIGRLIRLIKSHLDRRLESRRANLNHPKPNDLLETLMDIALGSDYSLSLDDITHLIFDLYLGGTDTTLVSIEWVMTELLLHPDILLQTKDEVTNVVGDRKIVEEVDISRLPYLQAVIKEVFRCHPPGPFLIPRRAIEDTEINGYFIPKDTRLIVNVWAISRDPSVWPNPGSFEPERFLNKSIDFKGQYFELTPFGSGRRICPGIPLVHRVVHTIVATLIHNFDWKFAPGQHDRNRDILAGGISLRREVPLVAIPVKP
nr:cytochrome P450 [Isodon lophanthoides var. gerardianus]